jgi:hypothetical protein
VSGQSVAGGEKAEDKIRIVTFRKRHIDFYKSHTDPELHELIQKRK